MVEYKRNKKLPEPEAFTHPLMKLALNNLKDVAISMPDNDLFEKVLVKIK